MTDFHEIFEENFKYKAIDIEELDNNITVSNPYTQRVYTLTHRYRASFNTFVGFDFSDTNVHVKIFPCANYSGLKTALKKLSNIYKTFPPGTLVKLYDSFEIYDNNIWYIILVTETIKGLYIYDLSKYMHERFTFVSKDFVIGLLLALIAITQQISTFDASLIYPNSVMVYTKPEAGGLNIIDENYGLLIFPFGNYILLGEPTRIENLYMDNNNLWGVGLCIYGFIGSFPFNMLPKVNNFEYGHILNLTPIRDQDPALEYIFRSLQKNDGTVLSHYYLDIWKGIYNKDWESIDKSEIRELEVLHSGLFFNDPTSRKLVIKKILILGRSYYEVYEYLIKRDIFSVFIYKCIKMNWDECPELLEPFYRILKNKPKDHLFKRKLGEMGILKVVCSTIKLDLHNRNFYGFIQDYASENTLTVMQLLHDSGFTGKAIEMAKKSVEDQNFLKVTMSYYGQYSVKVIEQVYYLDICPVVMIIQALNDIPYHFKFEHIDPTIALLISILKKRGNKEDPEIIKASLDLVTELLYLPNLLQTSHLLGKCSSHLNEDLVFLSKNHFLYYCIDCNTPLCSSCYKCLHYSHEVYNLLYMTPHCRCNNENLHDPLFEPADFKLPKYTSKLNFIYNSVIVQEKPSNRFESTSDTIITSENFDPNKDQVPVYYEVEIAKAGKYENIVVGLIGPEIYYHSMTGAVTRGSTSIGKAPRFGSFDTIGIGVLRNSKVFITYNGLLSSFLYDCNCIDSVKIFVGLYGDDCEVEIKLKNFLFQGAKPGFEIFNSETKKKFDEILNILINSLRKANQPKDIEMKNRLKDLLEKNKRNDLLKKLLKKSIFS
jgi:hypothetical protein